MITRKVNNFLCSFFYYNNKKRKKVGYMVKKRRQCTGAAGSMISLKSQYRGRLHP